VQAFGDHLSDERAVAERVADYLERLPHLRLLVTTGARNAAIDMTAAHARGVVVVEPRACPIRRRS
jgi:hypothetical protein